MPEVLKDDRTPEQKKTHTVLVVGTDRFMSGWGNAPGTSYAAWACLPADTETIAHRIRARSDMKRVRVVDSRNYRPKLRQGDHFHIYVYRGEEKGE